MNSGSRWWGELVVMKSGDLVGFKRIHRFLPGFVRFAAQPWLNIENTEICIFLERSSDREHVRLLTSRGPLWFSACDVVAL